ncbi:hypothetical protein M2444_005347 [Paenibacillus sp. PastF-3]|nr:hypothetical protein [Paenibacillus sp. PastF-3]
MNKNKPSSTTSQKPTVSSPTKHNNSVDKGSARIIQPTPPKK